MLEIHVTEMNTNVEQHVNSHVSREKFSIFMIQCNRADNFLHSLYYMSINCARDYIKTEHNFLVYTLKVKANLKRSSLDSRQNV